jgi:hypothetical protein
MVKSFLSVLASVFWLVVRYFKRQDDPARQYDKAKNENATLIQSGDEAGINRKLDELTDGLPPHADGDSQ